ncbi:holo-ACP synthase [Rhodococcus sp. X156]|uniref:holo-ACP synthase n=1 Tax=Rhodococcus sp. X156 TaxID=2499145 RepID=UPI0032165342
MGCDLQSVGEVADSVATFGRRYLDRVYTAGELAASGERPERLAARFAAKEAVAKTLRTADAALPWPSIEIVSDPGGWCGVRLSGPAAALARAQGLGEFEVSLSHTSEHAMAVVHVPVRSGRDAPVPKEAGTALVVQQDDQHERKAEDQL